MIKPAVANGTQCAWFYTKIVSDWRQRQKEWMFLYKRKKGLEVCLLLITPSKNISPTQDKLNNVNTETKTDGFLVVIFSKNSVVYKKGFFCLCYKLFCFSLNSYKKRCSDPLVKNYWRLKCFLLWHSIYSNLGAFPNRHIWILAARKRCVESTPTENSKT